MSNRVSSVVVGLLLLATVVVPPAVYMAMGASSMAAGVLLISGLYVFMFMAYASLCPSQYLGTGIFFIAAVMGVVFTQGALSLSLNKEFDFGRFWQSNVFLTIFLLGAISMALLAQRLTRFQADFAVKLVFYVLVLCGLAGILSYSPFSGEDSWRPVLFFAEPSHFALSLLPFLLYVVVFSSSWMKWCLISAGFLMALLLESLTLLVGIALVVCLVVPLRRLVFLALFAALFLVTVDLDLFSTVVDLDYYAARTDLSRENQNLSALAFMQGWERAYLNLEDSNGLGVGFQQFGIVGRRGEIFEDLARLSGEELNLLDGGSVGPKLIGEFGVFGLVTLLVYLAYFAKRARWLRKVSLSSTIPCDRKEVFFIACFVMYCIDIFVRGTGYFSATGFLFIVSVLWLAFREHRGLSPKMSKMLGPVH